MNKISIFIILGILLIGRNARQKLKMDRKYKCRYCNKAYAMEWAKDNHEKNCKGRIVSKTS